MPDKERVRHAAETIITRCLALPAESELAIIADETTLLIAQALAEAAEARGHRTTIFYFHSTAQKQMGGKSLAEATRSALRDVAGTILCLNNSAECLPFRISVLHTSRERGRKVAHMPGANWRTLLAADADYDRLTQACVNLALALVKGTTIEITSFDQHRQSYSLVKLILRQWRAPPKARLSLMVHCRI
jgi:hypothetical protein